MISAVYGFEAVREGILPFSTGYGAYGLAARASRGLADDFLSHRAASLQTYTFSSFFPLKKDTPLKKGKDPAGYPLKHGDMVGLRVTFLEDIYGPRLHEALSGMLAEPFAFMGNELKYKGWAEPGKHPLSRVATAEEMTAGSPPLSVTIAFLSPTSFRVGESNLPLPHPPLVFSSLLRKWEAWGLPDLGVGAGTFAGIRLGRFTLESKVFKGIKGALHFGFVGKAQFDGSGLANPEARKAFQALSAFSFFSGIGIKTTQGMGQAIPELLPKDRQN